MFCVNINVHFFKVIPRSGSAGSYVPYPTPKCIMFCISSLFSSSRFSHELQSKYSIYYDSVCYSIFPYNILSLTRMQQVCVCVTSDSEQCLKTGGGGWRKWPPPSPITIPYLPKGGRRRSDQDTRAGFLKAGSSSLFCRHKCLGQMAKRK